MTLRLRADQPACHVRYGQIVLRKAHCGKRRIRGDVAHVESGTAVSRR